MAASRFVLGAAVLIVVILAAGESGGALRLDGAGESGGALRLDGAGESGRALRLDGAGESGRALRLDGAGSAAPQDPPQQTLPPAPVVPPQKPRPATPGVPGETPQPAAPADNPPAPERQVQQHSIEIPYHGLAYSMLAKGGVTLMAAQLNRSILEYATVQVWISNGSKRPVRIAPQLFEVRQEQALNTPTPLINGTNEDRVLNDIQERAKAKDLGELVSVYETTLFGFANEKSVGFYEARKRAVLSNMGGGGKFRAVATASAIILPDRVLKPGEVLDGTVFFRIDVHNGRIAYIGAHLAGATFDFPQTPQLDQHVH